MLLMVRWKILCRDAHYPTAAESTPSEAAGNVRQEESREARFSGELSADFKNTRGGNSDFQNGVELLHYGAVWTT